MPATTRSTSRPGPAGFELDIGADGPEACPCWWGTFGAARDTRRHDEWTRYRPDCLYRQA